METVRVYLKQHLSATPVSYTHLVKACQIRIGEGETCVVETLDRAGNEKILTDGFNREVVFEPGDVYKRQIIQCLELCYKCIYG